ncbi:MULTISPECIES: lysophospholipid acyltransferase family protein [Thiorhodovibrio]|uniref:lysophospholipid acyltransferase family protein n=1 Tax=Thiorhodovibrio TaxID=61593 RepID=UPI001A9301BE|nr:MULTISPECIES: lysophospholipid acyltransferase family protein [Thiorhodovibrio]WPL10314.1 2-acyl-glycerophospho-ethanolamine acyltransferase [Thiorhodovibrio litoralis]
MIWRLLRTIEHLLTGTLISLALATLRALGQAPTWQPDIVRWWHRRLCRILALRVEVVGDMREPALVVANHISWLDIPILGAHGHVCFLSKSEVRRWPILGWMAAVAGTLFIERGANRFAEAIDAVRARITAGFSVVVFAEGTTSNGAGVRRFLPRLFAVVQPPLDHGHDGREGRDQQDSGCRPGQDAAAATHPSMRGNLAAPIKLQPVALRYGRGPQPHPVAPFINDDILVPHLWRLLKHPGIEVRVVFLPPIDTTGRDRRTLAEATRTAIVDALEHDADPAQGTTSSGLGTQAPDRGDAESARPSSTQMDGGR